MSMNELNLELNKIQETKTLLKAAIINKGQEVLDTDSFRSYVDKVNNITTGIDTSDANAIANDIVKDKTAYVNGEKVTGTIPIITTDPDGAGIMYADEVQNIGNTQLQFVTKNTGIRQILDINSNIAIRTGNTNIANVIGLTADKIIEGNTILGIEGTGKTSEDLQGQLDAQDTVIQQLQDELANKTSGSAKPNIFMQETEPTTKNGIWLKGNYQVDNIVADENIFYSEEWNTTKMSNLKAIPYSFYSGSAVAVGTNVYLFGGATDDSTRPNDTKAYKYDTLTDTYTKLTNIPYRHKYGSAVAIGTNIYLLGTNYNSSYYKYAYKYDTLTDTYTQITNIPYDFYYGSAVSIGTDIYLFGSGASSSYYKYAYKYDTLTDTYTKLTNIPYDFYGGSAVSIGTDVYLFGSYNSSNQQTAYKYNTLTDTYTKLTNIPYEFTYGSAVSIGTDIYLFGSSYSNSYYKKDYKYDTLTNTYTQLTDIPYIFYSGSAIFNGVDIYLLGGISNKTKVQVMSMIPNDYGNNSIVISQGVPSNKTNIANYGIQNAKFYYDRVYYQDENGKLLNTIPTYNGNGTEWVKISGGEG